MVTLLVHMELVKNVVEQWLAEAKVSIFKFSDISRQPSLINCKFFLVFLAIVSMHRMKYIRNCIPLRLLEKPLLKIYGRAYQR